MPDIDKILEAEQSIQSISSELKRMRDGADLLQSSQAQLDSVITSAQRVIQVTEKFSGECGVIVTKLAATDLNQRLDELQMLHSEIETAAGLLKDTIRSAIDELQNNIHAASSSLSDAVKAADEHATSGLEKTVTLIKEQAEATNTAIANIESKLTNIENHLQSIAVSTKKRQIITMVFVILTFLVSLFLLSRALVPIFG